MIKIQCFIFLFLFLKFSHTYSQSNLPVWIENNTLNDKSNNSLKFFSSTTNLIFEDGTSDKFTGYYVKFNLNNKNLKLETKFSVLPLDHIKLLENDENLMLILNGGYFSQNGSLSLVISNDSILSKNPSFLVRDGKKLCVSRPAFYFKSDLDPLISWVYTNEKNRTFMLNTSLDNHVCENAKSCYRVEFSNELEVEPDFAVGGGPLLIKDGVILSNYDNELFYDDIINSKAPRTAIGITKEKDIIAIVVDGRQSHSKGITLSYLSKIMKNLGCLSAMNLDGGGSSFLYAFGNIINKPSSEKIREITSSIVLLKK